jgi:hypothetical protein
LIDLDLAAAIDDAGCALGTGLFAAVLKIDDVVADVQDADPDLPKLPIEIRTQGVEARDLDALVSLFVDDVRVGRELTAF